MKHTLILIAGLLLAAGCEGNFLTNAAPSGSGTCGNNITESGETCDGTCPASCEVRHCQIVTMNGSAASCDAECQWAPITACLSGDGCCAPGCSAEEDEDCNFVCGDGEVEAAETCDGDCPTSCDDGDACTVQSLQGSAANCNAQCVTDSVINTCVDGDGCCPTGCNQASDSDCSGACGNGTVEPGETCDGDCPTSCDDGNACTTHTLTGSAATCNASCTLTDTITACVSGDGCCPAGCNATTDNDCTAMCGNGVVEANETCDGNCPAACDDGNACTVDAMQGSAATCNAVCAVQSNITACVNADGCCPAGCTPENDNDCQFDCTDIDAWPSNWAAWEDDVITEVNIRRSTSQTCGIYGTFAAAGPVTMSPKMRIAARCHSQDMGDRNRLGHDGSNGSSFSQRLGEAGYNGQPRGENVAAGQSSPAAVVTSWMNSQGHCRNIMNGDINRMGIGYFYIQQSTYRHWWTMVTGIGGTN